MSEQTPHSVLGSPQRLTALRQSGVQTEAALPDLERAARVAARLLNVPVAAVNLVLADRQVTRAAAGERADTVARDVPLEYSYCQLAVQNGEPLVIPDAVRDPRVCDNPATREFGIGAYLGTPIAAGGQVLGTLCVFTLEPRNWTAEEVASLQDVAALLGADLEHRLADSRRAEAERAAALRDLRESEDRYHALITTMDQGFCLCEMILDEQGRAVDYQFLEVNRAFEEMTGLVDAAGKMAYEMIPVLEDHWVRTYERVAFGGEPVRFQEGSDAMGRWFDVYASAVGPEGSGRFAVLFTDITTRKQADAERERLLDQIQAEQARLQQVFSAAPAVMALFSGPEHIITLVNPTWEQTVGKPNAIGRPFRNVFPEFAETGLFQLLDQVYESREPYINPEVNVPLERWGTLDNTYWNLVWLPLPPRQDGERDILVHAVEVTQQVRARETLRGLADAAMAINSAASLDELLQTITDQARRVIGAHQSITSTTTDDNLAQAVNAVSLSDRYAEWRGYEVPPNGSSIYALVCETNQAMRMTQEELERHPRWRNFSGEAKNHPPMRGWLAVPLIGRDGRNIGLIQLSDKEQGDFTVQDEVVLTQLAQTASVAIENARLYQEAVEANRAKSDFLATMSHELRTPLNAMIGYTQLLEMGLSGDLAAAARHQVERIGLAARHLLQIIEEILTFSRIEAGREEVDVSDVDLAEVLREVNAIIEPLAEAKGLRFQTRAEGSPATVPTDARKLRQILVNLLGNAVKFTERGEVELALSTEDDQLLLRVRDTGIGIEREHLTQLWEPFWQADASSRRTAGGTGLGLAVSRRLARLLDGDIDVQSTPDEGTTFTVRLPLNKRGTKADA